MYVANGTYNICMSVLDVWIWSRGGVPGLGDRRERQSSKRVVNCDILTQCFNKIDRILMSSMYIFFFGSPPTKNSEVKHVLSEIISGWVISREVFSGTHK
jgi:hypothetical protein